ncbi:hypothetical protein [Micromonospora musae]|uniref:hypothetical protein n=1 Tax=Micromonospora musae TaxID=1894970 RepID=UPI00342B12AF
MKFGIDEVAGSGDNLPAPGPAQSLNLVHGQAGGTRLLECHDPVLCGSDPPHGGHSVHADQLLRSTKAASTPC